MLINNPSNILPNGTTINNVSTIYSNSAPSTRLDGTALQNYDIWYDTTDYNSIYRWDSNASTWLPLINPSTGQKTFSLTLASATVTGSCTAVNSSNYKRLTIAKGASGTGIITFGNISSGGPSVSGRSTLLDFGRRICHVNRMRLTIYSGTTYRWYQTLTDVGAVELNQKGYGFKIDPSGNIYLQIHDGTTLFTSSSLGVLELNNVFYAPEIIINWDGVSKVSLWIVHPWYNTLSYLGSLSSYLTGSSTNGLLTLSLVAASVDNGVFCDWYNYYSVGG